MSNLVFELKNNLPKITIMKLLTSDYTKITDEIFKKKKAAPMMLAGLQVIVDIDSLAQDEIKDLNLSTLKKIILDEGIIPIAVMTDHTHLQKEAVKAGLGAIAHMTANNQLQSVDQREPKQKIKTPTQSPQKSNIDEPVKKEQDEPIENKIIQHPVRSGQRIYAKNDLTIIGSVSPGSEVIAGGNIHVYGSLKGRAIAGANGDESAQIFCLNMNAELISIAGNYKQLEDINNEYFNKSIRITLNNEKICFFLL